MKYQVKLDDYLFKLFVMGLLQLLVAPLTLLKVTIYKFILELLVCPGRGFWALSPNPQANLWRHLPRRTLTTTA